LFELTLIDLHQGRNEGGTIPRASNHCGGRRKVPIMSQVISSIQHICFRNTSGSNTGRQTCFLPRVPSNLVTPLIYTQMRRGISFNCQDETTS